MTRDRDHGHLVFVMDQRVGVLYLRMLPSNAWAVHRQLLLVLEANEESVLLRAFVVVEPARHRLRRLPAP